MTLALIFGITIWHYYLCRNNFFLITSGFFQYGNDIKKRGMVECKVESTLIQKRLILMYNKDVTYTTFIM